MVCALASTAGAQAASGSIRGVVTDREFEFPIVGAAVEVLETGQKTQTRDQGSYVLLDVPAGTYTLIFSAQGYNRLPRTGVVVSSGARSTVDVALTGQFTEMEEIVVEETLNLGAGSEAQLLQLRFDSPALLDSVGSDLMSRAGASDAASALRLVSGATIQNGKSAVIRGLPDRYVSSQLNGMRLPTADSGKRAVELDQFPASVIESIQVSKTFTPDQQGDASGGAVDVRLKGVPDKTTLAMRGQYSINSNVGNREDFLTYDGGGLDLMGEIGDDRSPQTDGENWDGAVGVSRGDAPTDYKWSIASGSKLDLGDGVTIGGFAAVFYERDSSFYDDGIDDSYWVTRPGEQPSPEYDQGTPEDGQFFTSLYDVTRGQRSVQWGGMGALGVETENHDVTLTYLYSRTAEDTATLAEDTRGKEYYFPGYDPDDIDHPGNDPDNIAGAPYIRTETVQYTKRTTGTVQLRGGHVLPIGEWDATDWLRFKPLEFDWAIADSFATSDQPDRRDFGSWFAPASLDPGAPPFLPPFRTPPTQFGFRPAANINLGNLNRVYEYVEEESWQYLANLEWPFEMWEDERGFIKTGVFSDQVDRTFDQDTFKNIDTLPSYQGDFDDFWSDAWVNEDHPIGASDTDVDYDGELNVSAYYGMVDIPLGSAFNVVGGARFETTEIKVRNDAEEFAFWFPPGEDTPTQIGDGENSPDVDYDEDKILPAMMLSYEPIEDLVTLRTSYSRTVARQTFRELTPIIQQEFLGGPVFIGNPELTTAKLENYDIRLDYTPFQGSLFSVSWFHKEVEDPIEYVQRIVDFSFTTPVNYPEGELTGIELEARQALGDLWEPLGGISVGANATFIDSEVTLPESESALFDSPNIQAPLDSRDATDAPDQLLNFFLTYDLEATGTRFGIFYTFQGDTLVEGATQADGNFIPNVYAKAYDTLNVSIQQKLGEWFVVRLQAKNLTNPEIETVYRSEYISNDVTKTRFTRGIDYSLSIGANFSF